MIFIYLFGAIIGILQGATQPDPISKIVGALLAIVGISLAVWQYRKSTKNGQT
jgi:energy-converting hydrogenase Eha subunit E